jgi:hypothetical protein
MLQLNKTIIKIIKIIITIVVIIILLLLFLNLEIGLTKTDVEAFDKIILIHKLLRKYGPVIN